MFMVKEERNVLVLRAVLFRSTLPYVVFFLFSPPAWLILLWPGIDIIYLLKCQTRRTLFWAQTRDGNRALANFRGWVWIRSHNIVFFYTYYTLQGSSSLRRSLWKCISDVFVMLEEHHWFSVSAAFNTTYITVPFILIFVTPTADYVVQTRSNQHAETIVALSAALHCAEDYIIPRQTYSGTGIPQSLPAALTQEALDPSCHIFVFGCFVTF